MVDFPGYMSVAKANSVNLIEFPYQFVLEPYDLQFQRPVDQTFKEKFMRSEEYSGQFMRILLRLRMKM